MKIFFTASRYESFSMIEQNYQRATEVFNQKIIYFSVLGNVFETFDYLCVQSNNQPFVWIDGDNWLYDDAVKILDCIPPTIMLTDNEYGIVYGHGGIKFCKGRVQLPKEYQSIDCSKHAGYSTVDIIGSYHHFGEGLRKIRTIWVEMCKLALRGSVGRYYLEKWIIARPDVWSTVHQFLSTSSSIQEVKKLLNNRTAFQEYYESKLCSHLQE